MGGSPHRREPIEESDAIRDIPHLYHSQRRRVAIRILHDIDVDAGEEEQVKTTHRKLARQIAAVENDIPPEQVGRKKHKSAMVDLRQNHLRVLDEHELVNWNERSGVVTTTERTESLEA